MWRTDSFEKTLMLGKIEGGRRRGRQDQMVGWHRQLNGHKFEQAPGVGDGQGTLVCCGPWSHKVIEWLNWTIFSLTTFGTDYDGVKFPSAWLKFKQMSSWLCCLCSVMSNSLWPHGLEAFRLLCPWEFPVKNILVGCHFLLQEIFLTQGLNLCL